MSPRELQGGNTGKVTELLPYKADHNVLADRIFPRENAREIARMFGRAFVQAMRPNRFPWRRDVYGTKCPAFAFTRLTSEALIVPLALISFRKFDSEIA